MIKKTLVLLAALTLVVFVACQKTEVTTDTAGTDAGASTPCCSPDPRAGQPTETSMTSGTTDYSTDTTMTTGTDTMSTDTMGTGMTGTDTSGTGMTGTSGTSATSSTTSTTSTTATTT